MKAPNVVIRGETWWKFFADFHHEGTRYCFDFYARSQEEADAMLRAIRTTAIECHQIQGEVSAVPLAGWYVRAYCFLRNLLT